MIDWVKYVSVFSYYRMPDVFYIVLCGCMHNMLILIMVYCYYWKCVLIMSIKPSFTFRYTYHILLLAGSNLLHVRERNMHITNVNPDSPRTSFMMSNNKMHTKDKVHMP